MHGQDAQRAVETVWRIESPRLIAGLVRLVRDVDLAEEFAQDALVAALERWPRDGVPDNPGAWLMTTARHRALDRFRRERMSAEKLESLARELDDANEQAHAREQDALDDEIGDDLLRLMFVACHPTLSMDARVALTLRLLGGLTTDEIARAFLVPEATVAQRIVRAKRTLAEGKAAYEVPRRHELDERMPAVLGVIYLVFNEGYSATAGEDLLRPALCGEALRLGRVLAGLAPQHAEAHGLLALMEIQASRMQARVDAAGQPILLADQDRARWDRAAIDRGLSALERAERLSSVRGPYTLQAGIAACHARAATAAGTDWARIVALYDALLGAMPSPVVALNHAVAVSMLAGPGVALPLVDALREVQAMKQYHLLPVVRGDLLQKLGRHDEAREEFIRAAGMTRNERERDLLMARADVARDQASLG
ncbi:MAG: RNA polymerase sigma factor [Luteimonas sp.]|nr:RNA polymerase sigma factor [Luteimonas sp.]